jgi:hypothetical protein
VIDVGLQTIDHDDTMPEGLADDGYERREADR